MFRSALAAQRFISYAASSVKLDLSLKVTRCSCNFETFATLKL
jgi:hypothetical protein